MRVSEVLPGVYRGPRPTMDQLKSMGIKTVISLESGAYEMFHDDEYEMQEDIPTLHLNCLPVLPPSISKMRSAFTFIETCDKPIYFHCAEGCDRTGWLAALLLVKYRLLPVDLAKDYMKITGFHMYRFWWWMPFFDYYVKELC